MANSTTLTNQIVFIDSRVQDIPALLAGLTAGIEVHVLDASLDGLTQISALLAGRSGIEAIHLFGHGSAGSALLCSTALTSSNLGLYQSTLAQIGQSLTATGDLLLYGCNVAQGDAGQAFIQQIAQLTGADVAASTDLTGAAALGGDWVLEAQAGVVEAQPVALPDYSHVLAASPVRMTYTQVTGTTGWQYLDTAQGFGAMSTTGQVTGVTFTNFVSPGAGSDFKLQIRANQASANPADDVWVDFPNLGLTGGANADGAFDQDGGAWGPSVQGINVDYRIAINWDAFAPSTLTKTFNVRDNNNGAFIDFDYTIEITVVDTGSASTPPPPANTAPTAGSGVALAYEGSTTSVTLSISNTTASDPENNALTFAPGSVSYTPAWNPGLKGTVNGVSSSSYTVTDPGSLVGTGGVYTWNVLYYDDPTTWSTDPATSNWNMTWSTSGINTTTLNGATDPENDAITYAIVSVNGAAKPGWMTINGSSGAITANVAPEFAGQNYLMVVSATSAGTSNPVQKTFTITTGAATAINDIPTISSPAAQTVAEDAVLTFGPANFNFADLDLSVGGSVANGATLDKIRIDTLPAHGTLKLNNVDVLAGDEIPKTVLETLTYTSNTDYSGSDSYTYSVNDGIAWSAAPAAMTLTVTPSNDAPVLVDGRPTLTTITENDTTNAGNLVSDLIDRAGGGAALGNKSGITDVDTLNNGGLGNAPESVGLGIAIISATNNNRVTTDNGVTFADYGTGGGYWEYSTNAGTSWTAVGTVSTGSALLLSATDKLRFVPDIANGTIGALNYYLWDGANGTGHATKVDVTTRGNATPYSVLSDMAYLVVSNVNDAPLLDLDGNNSSGAAGNSAGGGASFATEFLVRGTAVAIVDADMTIGDVDSTGGVTGPIVFDTVASATVAITAGATDNLFGTTYETLAAARYQGIVDNLGVITVTGTLGNIIVSNSGTASISISGAGTWAEYQNIIKAITYQNANPNAYPGARTVTVSIIDSATTDAATPATVSATSTITNVWAPSVDTNGVASGITYTTAYTEGGSAVKIASADATITDQDSHLARVVVSISNVQNAGSETLTIPGGNGTNWNGITGLTVSGSGTSTITLTGDLPPNDYQLALRSISYANSSDAPITTQRDITVVVTDIQDHVGDTGHSYINLTAVNDAPVLGAAAATFSAINEDDSASAGNTVAQLIADGRITDPDLSSGVPKAIAVSAVDNAHGDWQFKVGTGGWTAFDFTANSGKALLLDATDSVRFVPTADWNGTVSNGITFYAWDKTSGTVAGNYQTVSGNTGTDKVLSTATGTAALTVNPVNDAPIMSGSGADMASITEDDIGNAGQAVSALLATVNDIDSTPQGIAVYGTTVTGPTTGGKWQFKVDAGAWTDFGTVTEGAALLLKSTDLVRFVPDTQNGQTASFDYYAWDQYSGTAGGTTSVATRGGTTAFSTASDSVSMTVTNLNDAPVLDLDTSVNGTAYSTNFLVRSGVGVAVANTSGISISDVDVTAAHVHESIASATVAITAGAVDNTFGTIYEKLTSGSGTSVTSSLGNSITITGSGTPSITISGAGTPAEYQAIIKAITYENTNPNAYTGARTVTVTLTDSALTGGSAGTATATTTITNLWAPVVDTNGVATTLVTINGVSQEIGAGVKYVTSYTQGGSPVKVATADATITDEDSFLKSVVISIRDASGALVANADEKLTITLGNTLSWNGLGLTVTGSGTDTITLSGNLPPSIYQLALRSISYANTASAPGEVTRTIHVVGTDIDNHVGYTGYTDINVIPVNSPPTLAAVAITGSVAENALASTTVDTNLSGTLDGRDIETAAVALVYGVSGGTVGSGADAGKMIAVGNYGSLKVTTSGGAFEYVKNATAIEALAFGGSGQDVFTLIVADGTGVGSLTNTSPPTNGPARTYTVDVTGANDAPVATGTYTHTVTDSAALDTFTNLTGTLAATDVDTADTLTWSGSATGSYGALTVNANGTYSYVVNAAAVNALLAGSDTTDNFTVTVTDSLGATATRTVAMTVVAANDTPIATGSYTHTITDSAVLDTFVDLTGTLVATDVDTADTLTWSGSAAGNYGALTVNTDGTYSYVVNAAAVNALQTGSSTTENFTVTVTDSQNATATRTVAMTVIAANDTPIASGSYTHTITDSAALDTFVDLTGTLVATDVDTGDTLTWSGSATGSYGALTVNANGSYSYVVNAAAVNALQAGSNTTDSFTVTVTDILGATTTRTIAMTVVAANDTPVATGSYTHTITDSAVLDTFVNLTGTLAATDVDTADTLTWSGSASGAYGALTVNANGTYSYVVNAAAVNALQTGSNTTDSFTVTVTDSQNATTTRTIAMTVVAANDTPVATGSYTHTITDSAALDTFVNLAGTLVATDVDTGDTLTWSGSATGAYGALTVNANGTYSYVVNAAAVNALQTGSNTTDNFTVTVTDSQNATTTRTIAMTVVAANDTPVATGTYTHTVTDTAALDTFANLAGTLAATDVDTADTLTWSGSAAGSYGALTVNANGTYSYVVNAAAVNALQTGSNTTDSFTVTVTDSQNATTTRTIEMTVVAANDTPVVSNAPSALTGTVIEAGHLDNGQAVLNGMGVDGLSHITGQLSATDVDAGATQTWSVVGTAPSISYGTFSINAATGQWDFALNNYLPATQALREGDSVSTSYTARVTDDKGAFVDQTVTLTITGTNDVPVVANDAAALLGTVTEVGTSVAGTAAASGQLSASDVDNGATQAWSLVGTPSTTYGSMSIDASTGVWTYTLDNNKAATQALAANQTVLETFTARVTDDKGAFVNQTISVTLNGSDDKTVITGTSSANVAETNAVVTAGGTLIATDPDSSNAFVVQTNALGSNGFGKFSIDAAGVWSYTTDSAQNQFSAGSNYTDSITVAATDGTTQLLTVTIAGSNDAAVITGTSTASLSETNAVLTTGGTLTSTDVDGTANLFTVQSNVAGSNGFGKFSIDAAGVWSYTTDSAHNEFATGTNYTDSITVAAADGTTKVVTVTIAGSNDAAVISGTSTARRTQTNAALTVTGTLTSTDVDNPANLFAAQINAAGSNGYGKFSITTDGAWTYTADSAHNEFIAATDYTDSVTVATADGTTQVVAVTIAGVDDATTGAILISGTSTQGNTLSATSSLADVDSILGTVSYLWKADGQAITGATGSNYTLTAADVGKAITAVASYTIAGVATSSTSNASIASAAGGSTAQSSTVSTLPVTPSGASNSTEVAVVLNSNNGGSDQVQITKSGTGTSSVLPASMTAPLGVLNLTSSGNASGGENFSLYVDSAQGVNGYWVENAAHVWVNLASAAYGGQMVTEGGKTRLDFTIQDGSTYDTNATGNIIAAAGSAAHMELSLIGHTADVPLGGFFF